MAYHSTQKPETYHECKNCTEGNNIEKKYIKEGKGSPTAKKCEKCAALRAANPDQCEWGTPTPAK